MPGDKSKSRKPGGHGPTREHFDAEFVRGVDDALLKLQRDTEESVEQHEDVNSDRFAQKLRNEALHNRMLITCNKLASKLKDNCYPTGKLSEMPDLLFAIHFYREWIIPIRDDPDHHDFFLATKRFLRHYIKYVDLEGIENLDEEGDLQVPSGSMSA